MQSPEQIKEAQDYEQIFQQYLEICNQAIEQNTKANFLIQKFGVHDSKHWKKRQPFMLLFMMIDQKRHLNYG